MKKEIKKNRGFVMLFAVTLSSILLAVTLGVVNIALKEMKFGTNARDTNDAFFAADTAIESALFKDKSPSGLCALTPCSYNFTISQLGSAGQSCAKVTMVKTAPPIVTTIVSKGYNMGDALCNSTNPNRIERELRITY